MNAVGHQHELSERHTEHGRQFVIEGIHVNGAMVILQAEFLVHGRSFVMLVGKVEGCRGGQELDEMG